MSVPRSLPLTLLVLVTVVLLSAPAFASLEIPLAAQLAYGVPRDVAVSGNYAYAAAQGAVSVFDISTPANPIQVAVIDTAGSAEGVAVSGTYLYVAAWDAGLQRFNISNPLSPSAAGTVDTPGYAYGVAVAAGYAYVADHAAGIRVINLATFTAVGSYDTSGYAWDAAASGSYLLVADGFAGLVVLDVSTPASPSEVASCSAGDRVLDVAVSGDYAYLADGTSGLRVVDISGLPGSIGCSYATLATAGTARGVSISGDFAYLAAGTAGLHVVDVTDPSDPELIESCDTPGTAYSVAVANEVAYVADDSGGLRVVDVSVTPSPTLVSQRETPGNAEAISVPDDIAYVADGSGGIAAFDVSDPAAPAELWTCGDATSQAMDVAVQGDYAYVADWGGKLRVLDVSDPETPACEYGSCAVSGYPNGIAVSGSRAYVAAADAGLVAVDITDPANPGALWTINTPGSANDVVLSGNYAFVADGASGLQILDVVTTTGIVSSVSTSGYSWGVTHEGDYAYLASGDAGLEVIDVSTPASPSKEATLGLSGSAHSVSIYGDYAYVSVGGKGVAVVDVTDPTNPVHLTTCGTPSIPGPSDLVVAAGYAYVADAESGLVVIDLLPPYTELARRQSPSLGEKLTAVEQSDGSAVAYVASRSAGLQIVQVSDAEEADDPAFIRSRLGLGDVTDVAVQGAYGYVADSGGRLYVVGLTNATNPSPVGSAQTSGSARGVATTTVSTGSYALVADGSKGLSVVSTQIASSPFEKTTFDTPGWCSDVVPAVLEGEPFALAADGESGLRLINLSSIGTPAVTVFSDDFEDGLEGWTTGGTVEWYSGTPRRGTHSVRLRNDGSIKQTISTVGYSSITVSYYLAASLTTSGAAVAAEWFDGTDWNPLKQIAAGDADEDGVLHPYSHELSTAADDNGSFALRFKLTGSAAGDYGYVDDVMVKSASSSQPYEAGFYNTPGQARGVAVWGDYAFVADGDSGLRIIDITAPGNPVEVANYPTGGYAESVEMLDSVAVVASGDAGVVLVSCATPTAPVELASYDSYGWASDVALLAGHAYVAESGWGLAILRMWYTFKDILFSNWAFSEVEAAVTNGITLGYPDELYHPEIICSRDQMATFIARALAGGDENVPDPPAGLQSFPDIPDGVPETETQHWAYKYIEYCFAQGIVVGYVEADDTYFRPLRTVDRALMATFMARAVAGGDDNVPEPPECDPMAPLFNDVDCDHWAYKYIHYCVNADTIAGLREPVVRGYPDGYYRGHWPVTRDQMAVFIYRAFEL